MSEKLDADVHLIKAVEHLDEELRPFIDSQLEARQLEEERAASLAASNASTSPSSVTPDNPEEDTGDSGGKNSGTMPESSSELTSI